MSSIYQCKAASISMEKLANLQTATQDLQSRTLQFLLGSCSAKSGHMSPTHGAWLNNIWSGRSSAVWHVMNESSLWALSERKAAEKSLQRFGLLLLLPVVFSQGWGPGLLPELRHLVALERKNRETTEPAALGLIPRVTTSSAEVLANHTQIAI